MDVVIGLGANLGSRRAFLRAAADLVASHPGCVTTARSRLYETPPLGPPQPRYLNAAIRIRTTESLFDLLSRLQWIETVMLGRRSSVRWGPREIDLDILWADVSSTDPRLIVPHVELETRAFALAPLLDVHPALEARYGPLLDGLGGRPPRAPHKVNVTEWKQAGRIEYRASAFDRAEALAAVLDRVYEVDAAKSAVSATEFEVSTAKTDAEIIDQIESARVAGGGSISCALVPEFTTDRIRIRFLRAPRRSVRELHGGSITSEPDVRVWASTQSVEL